MSQKDEERVPRLRQRGRRGIRGRSLNQPLVLHSAVDRNSAHAATTRHSTEPDVACLQPGPTAPPGDADNLVSVCVTAWLSDRRFGYDRIKRYRCDEAGDMNHAPPVSARVQGVQAPRARRYTNRSYATKQVLLHTIVRTDEGEHPAIQCERSAPARAPSLS